MGKERILIVFNVMVPDFEMAKHFSEIIEIWENGDEKIKAWNTRLLD